MKDYYGERGYTFFCDIKCERTNPWKENYKNDAEDSFKNKSSDWKWKKC